MPCSEQSHSGRSSMHCNRSHVRHRLKDLLLARCIADTVNRTKDERDRLSQNTRNHRDGCINVTHRQPVPSDYSPLFGEIPPPGRNSHDYVHDKESLRRVFLHLLVATRTLPYLRGGQALTPAQR